LQQNVARVGLDPGHFHLGAHFMERLCLYIRNVRYVAPGTRFNHAGTLFAGGSIVQGVVYLVLWLFLFVMFLWSYAKVIHADPGSPRTLVAQQPLELIPTTAADVGLPQTDALEEASLLNGGGAESVAQTETLTYQVIEAKRDGSVRFCKRGCQNFKPDRSHHCSSCGRCILRMDHHCPWINTCVGHGNYSYFYLFVVYGLLYCVFVFATGIPVLIRLFGGQATPANGFGIGTIQVAIMCILAGAFSFALLFFVGLHTHLLLRNQTTIESMEDGTRIGKQRADGTRIAEVTERNVYDLGWRRNVEASFGKDVWRWPFPIARTDIGDGHSFPINADAYV